MGWRVPAGQGQHLPLLTLTPGPFFSLQRLLEAGATDVTAIVTHGLFSRNAIEMIEASDIGRVVVGFFFGEKNVMGHAVEGYRAC